MDKLLIYFLLTVSISQVFPAGTDYSYDLNASNGPLKWGDVCEKCNGKKQSPINIITADVKKTDKMILGQLVLQWPTSSELIPKDKGGKTVQLDIKDETTYTIQHGRTWQLAQFHLHWSQNNSQGSEHTIDGKEYPAEIHFVHFNPTYGNLIGAVNKTDGLMVVGFFIEVGMTGNTELGKVLTNAENKTTQTVNLTAIVNDALSGGYYNYRGSLTTPTCDESVTWNVFKTKLTVTQTQMDSLRMVMPVNGGNASRYRPVQNVNGRVVRECCQDNGTKTWQYDILDTLGPVHWGMVNKKCDGNRQSPIDIAGDTPLNETLKKLELAENWNTTKLTGSQKFTLKNKGYTVQLDIKGTEIMTKQNDKNWKLAQFHLHWSENDGEGSEHTMDGMAYPGEIHFVHYNPRFANLAAAVPEAGGLMVMGFFLKVNNRLANTGLNTVFDEFQKIVQYDTHTDIFATSLDLKLMVSKAMERDEGYYHYSGSLTTPPCDQTVTWNVMKAPIYVSKAQLAKLRMLQPNPNENSRNKKRYRPVQALNGRKVEMCCSAPMTTPTTRPSTTPCSGCYLINSVISIAIPVIALLKLAL